MLKRSSGTSTTAPSNSSSRSRSGSVSPSRWRPATRRRSRRCCATCGTKHLGPWKLTGIAHAGTDPPLLADKGLSAALEAQARKAAIAVELRAAQIGRYPQDIESTVYFCVLEALNNVMKYADARSAVVSLGQTEGILRRVRDDGRGFDTAGTTYGTGLQGMADRLEAVGGRRRSSGALRGRGRWSGARSRCRTAVESKSSQVDPVSSPSDGRRTGMIPRGSIPF